MLNKKLVYIETYGCSANQNNSEILAGILSQAGFIITNNPEIAEVIILNSCVVKAKTESKIKGRVQELKSSNKLLIIAGCLPETDFKKIKKINPNIIMLGTHNFKNILNLIRDFQEHQLDEKKQSEYISKNNEIKLNLAKQPINNLVSIHQISEGCLGDCSYCKTRLAKGILFSYPQEEIIKSLESDLQNGAKEIWLTSQDCAAYGLDKQKQEKEEKRNLAELLNGILSLKHKFKLRLGMSNPNNILPILEQLINAYKNPKMYKFLHIPIQSSSNQILKDMNRKYSIEQAEKIIKEFRKQFPDITIATDIITGYPTETELDHKQNLEFIQTYKPDVLNLSKFSSHKSTPAGKLKILKNSIVKNRASELMQAHRNTAKENKQKFKNRIIEVLIDKKISEHLFEARDENYNVVLVKTDKTNLGKTLKVQVKEIGVHHLIAEIVTKI